MFIAQLIGGGPPIAFIPQVEINAMSGATPIGVAIINVTGASLIVMCIIRQRKGIEPADRPANINFIPGRHAKLPFGARGVDFRLNKRR